MSSVSVSITLIMSCIAFVYTRMYKCGSAEGATWKVVSFSIHSEIHDVMTTAVAGNMSWRKQKPLLRVKKKQQMRRL